MNVHIETRDSATIIQPQGDVDLASSPIFRERLQEAQDQAHGLEAPDISNYIYIYICI